MTISVVKTPRPKAFPAAFSLLEIMFALSLIGLIMTIAVVSYKPDGAQQKMQKAAIELESLGARGHTMAVLHQKPFWLRFERNRVILQGAELETVDTSVLEEDFVEEDVAIEAPRVVSRTVDYDTFIIPDEMRIYVRRWGARENEWRRQERDEDPVILWNFESTALCEPISLRMEVDDSWWELEMDPLTGRVIDEQSEIYD